MRLCCHVLRLRCDRPATQLFDYVNDPEAPKFEAPVCDQHVQLIGKGPRGVGTTTRAAS